MAIDRSRDGVIQQMEHWGYYLLPQMHPRSPGYTGLLVAIRDKPTLKHFDPESFQVPLVRPGGTVEEVRLTLDHPRSSARLVPGAVTLTDRKNKQERFFSFGGTLESTSVPGETIYSLRSSAPVLWLSPQSNCGADQLASEAGRVLAEVRASYGAHEDTYYRHLASLEPLAIYAASLVSIFQEYEKNPDLRNSFPDCHELLHEEREWMQSAGLWSREPVTLEELLEP